MATVEDGHQGFVTDADIPLMVEESSTSSAATTDSTASATVANIIDQQQQTEAASKDITRPKELSEKVATTIDSSLAPTTTAPAVSVVTFSV